MDRTKFKETEEKYRELKDALNNGEISPEEMKKQLKKMMVLDDDGNYWMIGGKTGKWYIYNGTDWKEGNPFAKEEEVEEEERGTHPSEPVVEEHRYREPAEQDAASAPSVAQATHDTSSTPATPATPATPDTPAAPAAPATPAAPAAHAVSAASTAPVAQTAQADDPVKTPAQTMSADVSGSAGTAEMTDTTARADTLLEEKSARQTICKVCKAKVSYYAVYCQVCGANQKELAASSKKVSKARARETELLITSIKTTSLIFFLGGLGLIVGVLFGAAFGVFKILLPELQPLLPEMLADTRGGLAGGLIFAAIGGIAGFILSAVAAAIIGSVYNMVAFIFGGIRFKTK